MIQILFSGYNNTFSYTNHQGEPQLYILHTVYQVFGLKKDALGAQANGRIWKKEVCVCDCV